MKQRGKKIIHSTCYDYPTAVLMERAGVHMLNIGDSVGMTMLGGFKVQGKDAAGARKLIDDAVALEDVGCYAMTLDASRIGSPA